MDGDFIMSWIVLGENKGRIELASSSEIDGILPKGSFLTIDNKNSKFILRVENSIQLSSYSPSPLVVDMDLSPLIQDRKCKNIVYAYRIYDYSKRDDGLIEYINPQSIARRSNQEEINLAMNNLKYGPKVFIATVQYNQNQILSDQEGHYIYTNLPNEMFFHQILICGKTGSGKTVATKYLSQYFAEEFEGAVLAINVKETDLLKMDQPSTTNNISIKKEWETLDAKPHGINNFVVYYPSNTEISLTKGVNSQICKKITLNVKEIDPESLTGLLNNITDIGAMNLPDIFRHWKEKQNKEDESCFTFSNFVEYFRSDISFHTLNSRGDESIVTLHKGTHGNILRNLNSAIAFFDNKEAITLSAEDILERGKMSVIDVAAENGIQFGSILLRHLLHKIVRAKSEQLSNVPVLIVIDEVHMFYNEDASYEALGDLDTICRTGRSQEIGVIFSSQNPNDLPRGLSSVINTSIFFKSDVGTARKFDIAINDKEMDNLKKGFAITSIHDLSQIKIIKFPLALSGVFD